MTLIYYISICIYTICLFIYKVNGNTDTQIQHEYDDKQHIDLNVNDIKAIKAAEFALIELTRLSDTGIYESLNLKHIHSAIEEDGIFHYNVILSLELYSPYFKSGLDTEVFSIVVMTHKHDHVQSFAIDEFPQMNEYAIEEYYIAKVELKRKQREEAFRRLGTVCVECSVDME